MKRIVISMMMGALLLGGVSNVLAQNEINERQRNQQKRIGEGVENGFADGGRGGAPGEAGGCDSSRGQDGTQGQWRNVDGAGAAPGQLASRIARASGSIGRSTTGNISRFARASEREAPVAPSFHTVRVFTPLAGESLQLADVSPIFPGQTPRVLAAILRAVPNKTQEEIFMNIIAVIRMLTLPLLFVALTGLAGAQETAGRESDEAATAEVLKVSARFDEARSAKDRATLERILADGLSWTARGDRLNKAQVIADIFADNLHFKFSRMTA